MKISLPLDKFIAADNGPVPENLNDDLKRLKKCGLIKTKNEKWIDEEKTKRTSKRILLTEKGPQLANEVCQRLPELSRNQPLVLRKGLPKKPRSSASLSS